MYIHRQVVPRAAGVAKSIGSLHWHSSAKKFAEAAFLIVGAGGLSLLKLLFSYWLADLKGLVSLFLCLCVYAHCV